MDCPAAAGVEVDAVTSRFASNLLVLLAAAVMMGERFAFAPGVAAWLIFGGACFITVLVLLAFLARGRGTLQRLLDVCLAVIGGWSVISARTFPPHTAGWLGFAAGGACALLALIGLIAHEARMERGVLPDALPVAITPDDEAGRPAANGARRMSVGSWPN
jgi:hypothetical protein